jgi:hypothetical protein
MLVVGLGLLTQFARRHREACEGLRALSALLIRLRHHDDIHRQFGAIAETTRNGAIVLHLPNIGIDVAMRANFAVGIVRIETVKFAGKEPVDRRTGGSRSSAAAPVRRHSPSTVARGRIA